MKMSVDQPGASINRIALEGRLDIPGTPIIEKEFNAAVAGNSKTIVDLSKVSFIASLGIRMLVAAAQSQAQQGGKVVLVAPDELTRRVFKTTGIDQLISVCDTVDQALATF